MNGVTSEEGDSELSLKVDLQHFGEVCNIILCLYQRRFDLNCCLVSKRIHLLATLCMAASLELD